MGFDRDPRPPHVPQSTGTHCWAATFDSFSAVEPHLGGHVSQDSLLAAVWMQPYLSHPDLMIDMNQGWVVLTTHFGLQRQTLNANHVNATMFNAALHMSYVALAYVVTPGQASHVVLAYGVTDTHLKLMDPYRGYIEVPFTTVRTSPLKVAFFAS